MGTWLRPELEGASLTKCLWKSVPGSGNSRHRGTRGENKLDLFEEQKRGSDAVGEGERDGEGKLCRGRGSRAAAGPQGAGGRRVSVVSKVGVHSLPLLLALGSPNTLRLTHCRQHLHASPPSRSTVNSRSFITTDFGCPGQ